MTSTRLSHPKGAKTVLNQLKRTYGAVPKPSSDVEPIEQMILAILAYDEPFSKARSILQKLKGHYVDFNELRVTRAFELAASMGSGFANATAKAKNILLVLRSLFNKENSFDVEFLKSKSKQDLEKYFSGIQGADNYLISSVILHCCNRQAFPLDTKMLDACEQLQLAKGPITLENMQAYLERQLLSSQSYAFCHLLKTHSVKGTKAKTKKTAKKTEKKATKKKTLSKTKKAKSKTKTKTKTKKKTTGTATRKAAKRKKAVSKSKK